jgi:hypothetical protein
MAFCGIQIRLYCIDVNGLGFCVNLKKSERESALASAKVPGGITPNPNTVSANLIILPKSWVTPDT